MFIYIATVLYQTKFILKIVLQDLLLLLFLLLLVLALHFLMDLSLFLLQIQTNKFNTNLFTFIDNLRGHT